MVIRRVTKLNQIFFGFSENVTITDPYAFNSDNLDVYITGPDMPYHFDINVMKNNLNPLIPGKNISWWGIELGGFNKTLLGGGAEIA